METKPKKSRKVLYWALGIGSVLALRVIIDPPKKAAPETTAEPVSKPAPPAKTTVWTNVRTLVKANLKHPDTYEPDEWGDLIPVSDSTYVIYLKYKAQNSFGVPTRFNQLFYVNQDGSVYDVKDNNK